MRLKRLFYAKMKALLGLCRIKKTFFSFFFNGLPWRACQLFSHFGIFFS